MLRGQVLPRARDALRHLHQVLRLLDAARDAEGRRGRGAANGGFDGEEAPRERAPAAATVAAMLVACAMVWTRSTMTRR